KGIGPSASACASPPRESPSIWTTSRRRRPGVGARPRRARRTRRSTKRWRASTRSSRGMGFHCTIASAMDLHPNVVAAGRRFVEEAVRPAAPELEHADTYPHALVGEMRALGLFGALVPREYGGLGLDVTAYARVIEELCRGWMSLAGVINSHTMAALIVLNHGTEAQRSRFLPRFSRGEARGGLALTQPPAGTDVQETPTLPMHRGGAVEGRGFKHVMGGLEAGRINIAARAVGVAQAAFDDTLALFARRRDDPPTVVADMATKLSAARALTYWAAGMKDQGERCDL